MMNGLRGQKQTFLSNLGYRKRLKPVTTDSTAYRRSPSHEAEVTTFGGRVTGKVTGKTSGLACNHTGWLLRLPPFYITIAGTQGKENYRRDTVKSR